MFDLKTKVLIVDDVLTMRKIVSKVCRDLGFTDIAEASDGVAAWETLTNSNPSVGLIISDLSMPNCSGLDFLKRVRADSRFEKLPFFLVTADSEKSHILDAVKAGASGYVVKPFSAETLKDRLEKVNANATKVARAK